MASNVRPGAPDAFHSTPGMTDYVDPMGPMTQGPDRVIPATSTTPAVTIPAVRPYDAQYERDTNNINTGLAGLQSGTNLSNKRANEDYDVGKENAARANSRNLSALQNRLANQGIGYSGINLTEQGKIGEDYTAQEGARTLGHTRNLEDILRNQTIKQGEYSNQQAQAEIDRSGRETEAAKAQAANEAVAASAKTTGDLYRDWMSGLSDKILGAVQPQATPTGQMQVPKSNPQQIVQQAVKALPPPAAKTPQQQAAESGVDPKQLQTFLTQRGYSVGPIDGVIGIKSQQALAQFKQSMGMPATADITPEIWQQMQNYQMAGMNMGGVPGRRPGGNQI